MLIGVLGLTWTCLEFSVLRMGDAAFGPIGLWVSHIRTLTGGVCLGLIIAVLMARPYRSMTSEKPQTTV